MKGGAFMNPLFADILKKMLDFPKKIRHLIISSVQFSSVQFSSVQFSSVQFSSVQFSSVQFSSVQFSSVQFSSVTRGTPSLCKIQQSLFIILRRSFSAIAL